MHPGIPIKKKMTFIWKHKSAFLSLLGFSQTGVHAHQGLALHTSFLNTKVLGEICLFSFINIFPLAFCQDLCEPSWFSTCNKTTRKAEETEARGSFIGSSQMISVGHIPADWFPSLMLSLTWSLRRLTVESNKFASLLSLNHTCWY